MVAQDTQPGHQPELHHALGAQIPPLEGRIVVPATEVRAAERKLRVASRPVQDWVPGAAVAPSLSFTLRWPLYSLTGSEHVVALPCRHPLSVHYTSICHLCAHASILYI